MKYHFPWYLIMTATVLGFEFLFALREEIQAGRQMWFSFLLIFEMGNIWISQCRLQKRMHQEALKNKISCKGDILYIVPMLRGFLVLYSLEILDSAMNFLHLHVNIQSNAIQISETGQIIGTKRAPISFLCLVTNSNGEVYAAKQSKLDDLKCAPRVWSLETGIKLAG